MTLPLRSNDVSDWQRNPYKLFFPLGVLLAWAGLTHWLLLASGAIEQYRPIFHAFAQIEGFMTCFAVGFLFTFIPRRTGTAPPAVWQLAVAAAAPVLIVIAAWFEKWALAQAPWLVLMAVLIQFAVSRFRAPSAAPRVPASFVWVVLGLSMGAVGPLLAGAGMALGEETHWLHDVGSALVLQGMFTALALGVGGLMLPVLTRGASPMAARPASARTRALHLVAALCFVASFFIETRASAPLGLALRAAVVLAVLCAVPQIWRLPTEPGLHRKLIWLAAWMLPLGYACAAASSSYAKAWLHVTFIGGFALLTLCIALHVVLSHGGAPRLLAASPWPVALMGALLLVALVCRVLFNLNPAHAYRWLGSAAGAFLAATVIWGAYLLRALRSQPR